MTFREKKAYFLKNETEIFLYLLDDIDNDVNTTMDAISTLIRDPGYRSNVRESFRSGIPDLPADFTEQDYVQLSGILQALEDIGVQIKGGEARAAAIMRHCVKNRMFLPTTSFFIVEPMKAQEYIDIGIDLRSNPDFNHIAPTLEQASKNYAHIAEFAVPKDMMNMSYSEAKAKILSEIAPGNAENVYWEYKREKFQFRTYKRIQETLIDAAVERKVS